MTETPLSLNLTIYMLTTIGLTGVGTLFALISLAGTIRAKTKRNLFYSFFTIILTFYSLSLWLPTSTFFSAFKGFHWLIITNTLFYMTIFFYLLYYHFSLGSRDHNRTVITLIIIFAVLLGLTLSSNLLDSTSRIVTWIKIPSWGSITITLAGLFLLIRLIMAFCYHETGKTGATISLILFLVPTLIPIILSGSIRGIHAKTFTVYSLPLLTIWDFARLFTTPCLREKKTPPPLGELREQLTTSLGESNNLNKLLVNREEELGEYLIKARKVNRKLLPSVIHHDGAWEVTTYYNPKKRADHGDFFDFYYTYGRKLAGVSFFETPIGLNGALFTSLLKKEWSEGFNETGSLASLYRRINAHLNEIFDTGDVTGGILKLGPEKIEYTGYNNAPLYYLNGKLEKCAPLIQDRTNSVDEIKSYTIPCKKGDSFLLCNDNFLKKSAPITGKVFEKEKLPTLLETFKGNSSDMVKELIDERNKFLGKKDDEGILVIYLKRKA